MKTYILVPGIMTDDAINNWSAKAARWIENNTIHKAFQVPYFTTPFTRFIHQKKRSEELAYIIDSCKTDVVLIGHSNGCDLICKALTICKKKVKDIHLIAGATHSSFIKNKLNISLTHKLERVFVYCSENDLALKLAFYTSFFLKIFGLGFGYLGRKGPEYITSKNRAKTYTFWYNEFGHSDYFDDLEILMLNICKDCYILLDK